MNKWQDMKTAPKDKLILLDIGFPGAVVGTWNAHENQWCHPDLQVNCINGEWTDPYFENEYSEDSDAKGWMPLQLCPSAQQKTRGCE